MSKKKTYFYCILQNLKLDKQVYFIIIPFSLFHFIEGIIIQFWYKTVIHLMILLLMIWIYYRYKTFVPRKEVS